MHKYEIRIVKYSQLDYFYIYCLFAFFAFADFELDMLTCLKTAKSFFVDACVVHEDIAASFGCDKAITFG